MKFFKSKKIIRPRIYGDRYIYSSDESSSIIFKCLKSGNPCFITRFGRIELEAVAYFFNNLKSKNVIFPTKLKNAMRTNAGFFPAEDEKIMRFSSEILQFIHNIDIIGVWHFHNNFEEKILEKYNPKAKLISLPALGDSIGFFKDPWTEYLQGKKVLVIHPFENTIKMQYEKRKLLFKNPQVLPDFELKTLKAIQGIGSDKEIQKYNDWFEALDSMCEKIDNIDFDIALIGAGAYGIFLANHIKGLGKQAVHMGGALQILFGIKGSRWEREYGKSYSDRLFNEHWINPLKEDTPESLDDFIRQEGVKSYW